MLLLAARETGLIFPHAPRKPIRPASPFHRRETFTRQAIASDESRMASKAPAETTTVGLLLTNLRLLDLPVHPDLPVNEETFSLGKNKSKAFEHIAHHIFYRYDPVESRSRFAGTWPIYEPAQSKNFRAAVINWLNDLKKAGVLHNAVIIRKSMFDECQGDRYEELLLALSTMALKKCVEQEHGDALGNSIAFDEVLSLQPNSDTVSALSIAYQNSLRRTLQRRFVDKQRWFLASRRLEEQEQLVAEKEQATAIARESRKSLDVKERDIISIWEKNWIGDQAIYRLLLPEQGNDAEQELWSDTSFQRLFKTGMFAKGSTSSSGNANILQKMEESLKVHEKRLSQWSEFNEKFLKDRLGSKRSASGKKVSFAADVGGGFGIDFNKHQNLHASAFSLQEGTQLPIPSTEDEFGKLFNSMRKELQTIRVSRRKLGTLSYANTYGEAEEEEEEETTAPTGPKQPAVGKDITEEEALQLLTSHLPIDNTLPKQPTHPSREAIVEPLPAPIPVRENPAVGVLNSSPDPAPGKTHTPKPRLRSPPPPPKPVEPSYDDENDPDSTTPPEVSPVLAHEPKIAIEDKVILPRGQPHPHFDEEQEVEREDSVDEFMVEKITTSTDTPAPIRPHRIQPNPTWSKQDLEEDPFKPRPKVALSPQLTPYRLQRDNSGLLETPRVEFSSSEYNGNEDDDDGEDASPSKGRGRGHR
ncbi:hypothetical protein Dda_6499 [Drechslerella dactyloides]|uniref:HAUS augmin-like complex subunit 6 N-terminal domain-containing protein n=1 Tax=Drechslerella dactyloides TaxID=74499 RepID=A0AAD6NIZ5_DREDA|nr:hypothetical protein Dda_6499 [Drechslerella dactyloides]